MWSLSTPTWHVGLSPQGLTLAQPAARWLGRTADFDNIHCEPDAAGLQGEPWQQAVTALAQWLSEKGGKKPTLHVALAGRFVRWQLLPWQAEVTRPKELGAYAALRFHETFGKTACDWQVMHSPQPPGQTVPACAVDAALIAALRSTCDVAGARLATVVPHYACAFDRWRHALNKPSAWFGLIEPDCVSLGLLQGGRWLGLRSQRVDAHWREALPGMMAQMGIAVGLTEAAVPLYLTGNGDAPQPVPALDFTWLASQAHGT